MATNEEIFREYVQLTKATKEDIDSILNAIQKAREDEQSQCKGALHQVQATEKLQARIAELEEEVVELTRLAEVDGNLEMYNENVLLKRKLKTIEEALKKKDKQEQAPVVHKSQSDLSEVED